MTERFGSDDSRPPLYELFDDDGKAWLDELVRLFNDGAYGEAVEALLADEAAIATAAVRQASGRRSSSTT